MKTMQYRAEDHGAAEGEQVRRCREVMGGARVGRPRAKQLRRMFPATMHLRFDRLPS